MIIVKHDGKAWMVSRDGGTTWKTRPDKRFLYRCPDCDDVHEAPMTPPGVVSKLTPRSKPVRDHGQRATMAVRGFRV